MDIIPQLLWNSLVTGSLYACAAVAMAIQYSLLRVLNFATGQTLAVGAYSVYVFYTQMGWPLYAALLGMCVVIAVVAWLSLQVFILPFIRKGTIATLLTTLALGIIITNALQIAFGASVKTLSSVVVPAIDFGLLRATPLQLWVVGLAVAVLVLFAAVLSYSSFGRRLRAVAGSTVVAQALGIRTQLVVGAAFYVALLLAASGGVMIAFESNASPYMGFAYTIKAFAAMVLGGLGNIWGAIAAAFIIAGIENFAIGISIGSYSIPTGFKDAFAFAIILLALLFFPHGLFAKKQRAA